MIRLGCSIFFGFLTFFFSFCFFFEFFLGFFDWVTEVSKQNPGRWDSNCWKSKFDYCPEANRKVKDFCYFPVSCVCHTSCDSNKPKSFNSRIFPHKNVWRITTVATLWTPQWTRTRRLSRDLNNKHILTLQSVRPLVVTVTRILVTSEPRLQSCKCVGT